MKRIIQTPGAAPVVFPPQKLSDFLQYVRDVWDDLRAISPPWWGAKKETELVNAFFIALDNDDRRMKAGIGFGTFILEAVQVALDSKGMPKQTGRTDIRFAYSGVDFPPVLVMEFKRLDNTARLRRAYVNDGVYRFTSGRYAPEVDYGVMVGMVLGKHMTEAADLFAYLGSAAVVALTGVVGHSNPSAEAAMDFDTAHLRLSPPCGEVDFGMGHMLLQR